MASKKTEKRKNDIECLALKGHSKEEIQKELRIKHGTLMSYLKEFNIKVLPSNHFVSEEEKQKIIEMYRNGLNLGQIRKKTGRHNRAINACLKDLKIARKKKINIKEMIEMSDKGFKAKEISVHFNVDISSIRHALKRRGRTATHSMITPCESNKNEIIKLLLKGKTQTEICKLLNLHDNTLNTFITRNNLHDITVKNFRYQRSSIETEIMEKFKDFNPIQSYKYKEKGKSEIDVFLPDEKIGIELCGVYWHRESLRGKTLHKKKLDECINRGITLFTIFDIEWISKKDLYISIIKSKIGKSNERIYARDCQVKEVPRDEASVFFNKNHLQGRPPNQSIALGLYYNNELIGCMSFGKHHRNHNIFILNRLAFKMNCNVIGGSERLFKNAIKSIKNIGIKEIITYSDNRLSEGRVYSKLGFTLVEDLPIDYFYYKNGKMYSKQSMKKTKEERLTGKTEYELRKEMKFDRVWDCGKKKWIMKINP